MNAETPKRIGKMSNDEDYKQKRERNNESVKRCRINEKKKIEDASQRLEESKRENKVLEEKYSSLQKQLQFLKSLFVQSTADNNQASSQPTNSQAASNTDISSNILPDKPKTLTSLLNSDASSLDATSKKRKLSSLMDYPQSSVISQCLSNDLNDKSSLINSLGAQQTINLANNASNQVVEIVLDQEASLGASDLAINQNTSSDLNSFLMTTNYETLLLNQNDTNTAENVRPILADPSDDSAYREIEDSLFNKFDILSDGTDFELNHEFEFI